MPWLCHVTHQSLPQSLSTPVCRFLHITSVNITVRLRLSRAWQILARESSKTWQMCSRDVIGSIFLQSSFLAVPVSLLFKQNVWHFSWSTAWTYYLSISAFIYDCKLELTFPSLLSFPPCLSASGQCPKPGTHPWLLCSLTLPTGQFVSRYF